ncbi:MAG: DUF481 domain-containing protein [Opitutales bacterium]|nr:DUF481 domain-containing protein [Opitutales bacterium]
MYLKTLTLSAATLALSVSAVLADSVVINDGSQLKGTVQEIKNGKVFLNTPYAGVLEIDQTLVVSMETTEPISLRLSDGTEIKGEVLTKGSEIVVIAPKATMTASVRDVESGWNAVHEDPRITAQKEAAKAAERKWKFQVGVNIDGKDGNSQKLNSSVNASAKLEGPEDTLHFYTKLTRAETDGEKTDEEYIAGVQYDAAFSNRFGWYVRTEGEKDEFEDIDFRSTSAAGFSYHFYKKEHFKLTGRLGLAYRYEDYTASDSEEFPGFDVGLHMDWGISQWANLVSDVTYLPSVEDFGSYILRQDTGLEMPLSMSNRWILRVGVANDYNSEPEPGTEEMDTTYYARLILKWE